MPKFCPANHTIDLRSQQQIALAAHVILKTASVQSIKGAYKAFLAIKSDRIQTQTTEDITYLTYDTQKTMPLVKLTTRVAFYLGLQINRTECCD